MSGATFGGWVPSGLLDEDEAPPCRATPDDWLVRDGSQARLDGGVGCVPIPVATGDRVVFSGLTEHGSVRLVHRAPGLWKIPAAPPGATCFVPAGSDGPIAAGLASLAEALEARTPYDPGEEVDVECYDWRDATFVLRAGAFHLLLEEVADA